MKLIRIITAECGEPQLEMLKRSINDQSGFNIEHTIISNQNALNAEKKIHEASLISKKNKEDWIIRLDADMCLMDSCSISTLIKHAELEIHRPRFSAPVKDFFTGTDICCVNLLKPYAIPEFVEIKEYFPEKWIGEIPAVSKRIYRPVVVNHGFNPSIDQAIRFGLHRGLKADKGGATNQHWLTIYQLHANLLKNKNQEMLWVAMIATLIGLNSINDIKVNWSSVDIKSPKNEKVKFYLEKNIISFKNSNITKPIYIYKLFYSKHKSIGELLKYIYRINKYLILRNITPLLPKKKPPQ